MRTAILGALNTIAPTNPQVQELDQAVLVDARQSEEARRIAVEALVDAEKDAVLLEALPKIEPRRGAGGRVLPDAAARPGAVPDFTNADWSRPARRGLYLCLLCAEGGRAATQAQKQAPSGAEAHLPARTGCPSACRRASARPCAASCSASRASRGGCGSPPGCSACCSSSRSSTSRPRD